MKKPETVLRDFVTRASDESLKYLHGRLTQRLQGDNADVLDMLTEESEDFARLFGSAKTCWELFDMLDMVQDAVEKEVARRSESQNHDVNRNGRKRRQYQTQEA